MIDRFVGKTRIVLGGRSGDDPLILGVLAWSALVLGALLVVLVRSPERPWGIVALLALMLSILAWMARGPIARLSDKSPWLVADAEGLRLHPTLAPDLLPWSTVHGLSARQSTMNGGRYVAVYVQLRQPVRSLTSPWGAIEICIGAGYLGLSNDSATFLVRQLERLRAGEGEKTA